MIKINLLAEAKPVKKKRGVSALGGAGRLNLFLIVGGLVLGLLVVGVQWWVESSRLKEQEEKNRLAQQEVTRLEAVLKEVADFEDKKAKLQKKVDLINALKANQRGPVRLMDEVSNALPDLLWIERMEVKGNLITIDGKALNPPAVANFFENLKRVPAFQEPKLEGAHGSVRCRLVEPLQLRAVVRLREPRPDPVRIRRCARRAARRRTGHAGARRACRGELRG